MTRFVHVLPAGRLRWEVRVGGSKGYAEGTMATQAGDMFTVYVGDSPPLYYRRKAHALIAARAIAILIGGEVQPHNRWGRIQDPDSYGNDPERSVG